MAIRSILTSYTGSGGGAAALHMSVLMAKKYDARITGAVWQPPSPLRKRSAAFLTRDIDTILDQMETEFVDERRRAFDRTVAEAGLADRADFVALASTGRTLVELARAHDVVVMGSPAERGRSEDFSIRPDVIALRSGRPTIIVPADYNAPAINETAVVAWDGKRASARALADAMHILATKEKVTLLVIGEGPVKDREQIDDVLRLLALHGIDAAFEQRPAATGGIGRTILDTCMDLGAGILVMGAYEHSKFSEDLLGGVTRDILENADLPLLMSH